MMSSVSGVVQCLLTLSIAKLDEKHWSQGPLVGGEKYGYH